MCFLVLVMVALERALWSYCSRDKHKKNCFTYETRYKCRCQILNIPLLWWRLKESESGEVD